MYLLGNVLIFCNINFVNIAIKLLYITCSNIKLLWFNGLFFKTVAGLFRSGPAPPVHNHPAVADFRYNTTPTIHMGLTKPPLHSTPIHSMDTEGLPGT